MKWHYLIIGGLVIILVIMMNFERISKLPDSIWYFIGLLGVLFFWVIGLLYLKKKLTEDKVF